MNTPPTPEPGGEAVRNTLEQRLAEIRTPAEAAAVLREAEHAAADRTEQEAGAGAANSPTEAASAVQESASAPGAAGVAGALVETAAQAVAPTAEAGAVVEGAQSALNPQTPPATAEQAHGRDLLKEALLRRMSPLQALDVRLYLAINGLPHPPVLDAAGHTLAVTTRGGALWVAATLLAYLLRVPHGWSALMQLLPSVVGATWLVEFPIKRVLRRQRPFISIVQAVVVGKKPGSWSYPSGHTTASFACARVLSSVWPKHTRLFYLAASVVGVSRVYVGDHYPGDVLSGATIGTLLAEVLRRPASRLLHGGRARG